MLASLSISVDCKFRPTLHAKERFAERGVSREEATHALLRGARVRQGSKLVSRHRQLTVVWKKRPCRYIVITAMWEDS